MKTKLLLLLVIVFSLGASCSPDEMPTTEQGDCVKSYYLYFPAMSYGASYVPAHYDLVSIESTTESATNGYVHDVHSNYTHYKIECD